jgi:PhnB protein
MAKPSQSDQLDAALTALLANPHAAPPPVDATVAPLVRIADDLRDLPRPAFRSRLRGEIDRKASMATDVVAAPPARQTATAYLCVRDAAAAIEFYARAFGAVELYRLTDPGGRIGHAELRIGQSTIMLSDEFPDYGALSPQAIGGSPVKIHLQVDDVDAFARRAVAAGASLTRPVEDQFYGERSGKVADPFGLTWILSMRTEEVAPTEMQRRFDALMRGQGAGAAPTADAPRRTRPIPEGFHTVTPYLAVREAEELIGFVEQAFGAQGKVLGTGSQGGIHGEYRIGDSMVMIGGGKAFSGTPMPTAIHLYVHDADAVYQRAIAAGATSIKPPTDMDYGDREGSVRDLAGNHWYIATNKATGLAPPGLRTITPSLHPRGADQVVDFLKRAFAAQELALHRSTTGTILHAKVRIGDSVVEMGEAHGQCQPMPTKFFLYVDDADAWYQRAIEAGATSLASPADQPYGARVAALADSSGNQWYVATPIEHAAA